MAKSDIRQDPDLSFEEREFANQMAGLEPWYVNIYENEKGKVEVTSNLGDNDAVIAMIAKAQLVALVTGAKLLDQEEDDD